MILPAHIDPKRMLRWVLQGVALGGIATVGVFFFTVQPDTWTQLRAFNPAWLPVIEFPWRIMAGTLVTVAIALCYKTPPAPRADGQ